MLRNLFTRSVIMMSIMLAMLMPLSAAALTDPFYKACEGGQANDSSVCSGRGNVTDPVAGTNGALLRVTNLLALIAGIMAVIFLVFSGIQYITSGGDPAQVSKAKQSIIYTLVGIVIIALSRSIIGWVLSKV